MKVSFFIFIFPSYRNFYGHVCLPVRKIIHSLKLVDYLHVQADKPWYNYYVVAFQYKAAKRVLTRLIYSPVQRFFLIILRVDRQFIYVSHQINVLVCHAQVHCIFGDKGIPVIALDKQCLITHNIQKRDTYMLFEAECFAPGH